MGGAYLFSISPDAPVKNVGLLAHTKSRSYFFVVVGEEVHLIVKRDTIYTDFQLLNGNGFVIDGLSYYFILYVLKLFYFQKSKYITVL